MPLPPMKIKFSTYCVMSGLVIFGLVQRIGVSENTTIANGSILEDKNYLKDTFHFNNDQVKHFEDSIYNANGKGFYSTDKCLTWKEAVNNIKLKRAIDLAKKIKK